MGCGASTADNGRPIRKTAWEAAWCDTSKQWYFQDRFKKVSTWDAPSDFDGEIPKEPPAPPLALVEAEEMAPLPEGWEKSYDAPRKRYYYFHRRSGRSSWNRPGTFPPIPPPPEAPLGGNTDVEIDILRRENEKLAREAIEGLRQENRKYKLEHHRIASTEDRIAQAEGVCELLRTENLEARMRQCRLQVQHEETLSALRSELGDERGEKIRLESICSHLEVLRKHATRLGPMETELAEYGQYLSYMQYQNSELRLECAEVDNLRRDLSRLEAAEKELPSLQKSLEAERAENVRLRMQDTVLAGLRRENARLEEQDQEIATMHEQFGCFRREMQELERQQVELSASGQHASQRQANSELELNEGSTGIPRSRSFKGQHEELTIRALRDELMQLNKAESSESEFASRRKKLDIEEAKFQIARQKLEGMLHSTEHSEGEIFNRKRQLEIEERRIQTTREDLRDMIRNTERSEGEVVNWKMGLEIEQRAFHNMREELRESAAHAEPSTVEIIGLREDLAKMQAENTILQTHSETIAKDMTSNNKELSKLRCELNEMQETQAASQPSHLALEQQDDPSNNPSGRRIKPEKPLKTNEPVHGAMRDHAHQSAVNTSAQVRKVVSPIDSPPHQPQRLMRSTFSEQRQLRIVEHQHPSPCQAEYLPSDNLEPPSHSQKQAKALQPKQSEPRDSSTREQPQTKQEPLPQSKLQVPPTLPPFPCTQEQVSHAGELQAAQAQVGPSKERDFAEEKPGDLTKRGHGQQPRQRRIRWRSQPAIPASSEARPTTTPAEANNNHPAVPQPSDHGSPKWRGVTTSPCCRGSQKVLGREARGWARIAPRRPSSQCGGADSLSSLERSANGAIILEGPSSGLKEFAAGDHLTGLPCAMKEVQDELSFDYESDSALQREAVRTQNKSLRASGSREPKRTKGVEGPRSPEAKQQIGALRQHFLGPYWFGHDLCDGGASSKNNNGYKHDASEGDDDGSIVYLHENSGIRIWGRLLCLAPPPSVPQHGEQVLLEDMELLLVYMSKQSFYRSIASVIQGGAAGPEFQGLGLPQDDAAGNLVGHGVYASSKEPAILESIDAVVHTCFALHLKQSQEQSDIALRRWRSRAAYCIAVLAPRRVCYQARQRATPEMIHGPGRDARGHALPSGCDPWIIRISGDETCVQNAKLHIQTRLQAELKMREARFGFDDVNVVGTARLLGQCLKSLGQLSEAEVVYQRILAADVRAHGVSHPQTLTSVNNLAVCLSHLGRNSEAELLHTRAVECKKKALGKTHPSTLASVNNLAACLLVQGKATEAQEFYNYAPRAHCDSPSPTSGPVSLGTTKAQMLASVSYLRARSGDQAKPAEAEHMFRLALAGFERNLGPNHPDTLVEVSILAGCLGEQGQLPEAEALLRRVLVGCEQALGHDHPHTLQSAGNLAGCLYDQGHNDEAELLYQRALEGYEHTLGPTHPGTLECREDFAVFLEGQQRHVEARLLRCCKEESPAASPSRRRVDALQ